MSANGNTATSELDARRSFRLPRLHRSTWVILLLAAAALVLIIVPGEVLEFRPQEIRGLGYGVTMEHGWPWVWLRRAIYADWPLNALPPDMPDHGIPWVQKQAWSFAGGFERNPMLSLVDADRDHLGKWTAMLALDIAVAVAILLLFAAALEWRHRRRRLWQVSLAEVFVLMLFVSAALGWWMVNRRAAEAELEAVESLKVGCVFEYRGPRWLSRAVGTDLLTPFHRGAELGITPTMQVDYSELADSFSRAKMLNIASSIEDDDLRHVARMENLLLLNFDGPNVTNEGLKHLEKLRNLKQLRIRNTQITREGVDRFKLQVPGCRVSY